MLAHVDKVPVIRPRDRPVSPGGFYIEIDIL